MSVIMKMSKPMIEAEAVIRGGRGRGVGRSTFWTGLSIKIGKVVKIGTWVVGMEVGVTKKMGKIVRIGTNVGRGMSNVGTGGGTICTIQTSGAGGVSRVLTGSMTGVTGVTGRMTGVAGMTGTMTGVAGMTGGMTGVTGVVTKGVQMGSTKGGMETGMGRIGTVHNHVGVALKSGKAQWELGGEGNVGAAAPKMRLAGKLRKMALKMKLPRRS